MQRAPATIICDANRSPATSQPGDWHDVSGHHRYYGSSAVNGGERIVESRHGARPRSVNLCGF
ncbi:MAG: hypothetical protein ACRED3_09185 [Bradyrhizobium sp.]